MIERIEEIGEKREGNFFFSQKRDGFVQKARQKGGGVFVYGRTDWTSWDGTSKGERIDLMGYALGFLLTAWLLSFLPWG